MAFDDLDITVLGGLDAHDPPEFARLGQTLLQALLHEGLDLGLALVRQLVAVGANSLMPLSEKLLWEAEIITPRSARIERVIIATAGVGSGPNRRTSMPTEVKPATSAGSIM